MNRQIEVAEKFSKRDHYQDFSLSSLILHAQGMCIQFQWRTASFLGDHTFPVWRNVFSVIDNIFKLKPFDVPAQKYSRLRQLLQKFSPHFKEEPVQEGRLKVILLLQVSSHDFEPRRGVTEEVPAVGFCLGSGLFGSYNSD